MTPLLLVISDRPHVWVGFKAPARNVWRWAGERAADEQQAEPNRFAGDPTDPGTYRWSFGQDELSAVVDLQDYGRAQGAIDALRRIRPEAAVLVITADHELHAEDIAVSRTLTWTDALRAALEGELLKLEALRRLNELRTFAEPEGDVPILLHPDPDPDALASALAVRALLRRTPMAAPIITTGEMTRPENRRMAELLRMRVTVVTREEVQKLDRVIAVDCFPDLDEAASPPSLAVIDHHPHDSLSAPAFLDLRPSYGATATMMTEYLRLEDERRIAGPLATALLYGIKTDTDSLDRGSIAADVEAYAFLQNHADLTLLRQLERPSYSIETARLYGAALTNMQSVEDVAIAFLGTLPEADAHVLADIADFCLALEEITWAVAAAEIEDQLVLTIRHLGGEPGAGELAQAISAENGQGGGHASMARAVVPLDGAWQCVRNDDMKRAAEALRTVLCGYLETLRLSHRSSHPAHPETAPSSATR
ncbi:MAG TPA: DHH family phosphoesterase [Longimicrobiales bacterium]